MATAVTLKESDGSEIYPVTDISLVNGGISAHDILPASSVAPITTDQIQNGAVTSAKIDWSTIVAGATPQSGTISSDSVKTVTVSIPQQANANYVVLLTLATDGDYWTRIVLRAHTKTTTSFKVDFANNGSGTAASMWAYYLVVPRAS